MAISWLESAFPELVREAGDGGETYAVRAQPFVLLDASVSLQVIAYFYMFTVVSCFMLPMSVSSVHCQKMSWF